LPLALLITVMFKDAVFCSGTGGFFPANEAAEKSMERKQTSARRWIFMAAVILQPICLMQDTHCVGLPTDGKQ